MSVDSEPRLSNQAYLDYATGVAIFAAPHETQYFHNRPVELEFREDIAVHAEQLMYDGLTRFIKLAHPQQRRSPMSGLEHLYDEAIDPMLEALDTVYADESERLASIYQPLSILRPAVFTDEAVYRYICHSRYKKLTTRRLLGKNVAHDAFFNDFIEHRSIQTVVSKQNS